MTENIKVIGIVGAGTMGSGIAASFLISGFNVILCDINNEILENAKSVIKKNINYLSEKGKLVNISSDRLFENIKCVNRLEQLKGSDFIIEAALEELNVKLNIFTELNKILGDKTIFASNTSSIPISSLSKNDINKGRYIGMHFFNPPNIMKLVEVIISPFTADETRNVTLDLVNKLNKKPVICKDTPAFIVNRIARSFYGESLKIFGESNISVNTIDDIMKNEGGYKMGPFELMDLIGIDVNYSVTKSVYEAFYYDQKYKPHIIQKSMVDAGMLGKKTGKGFYDY